MTELKKRIISLAEVGRYSTDQIAVLAGCSREYVLETMRHENILSVYRIDWEEFDDTIKDMYDSGATLNEISDFTGINLHSLIKYVQKEGLDKRKELKVKFLEAKGDIFSVNFDGKERMDITDLMIDRVCIFEFPEWKKELQRRWNETQGREGINFGYKYERI